MSTSFEMPFSPAPRASTCRWCRKPSPLSSAASSTMPSVPIILIDKMLASGQAWWIRPAMKVPCPKNGSIRPCSGSMMFGSFSPPSDSALGPASTFTTLPSLRSYRQRSTTGSSSSSRNQVWSATPVSRIATTGRRVAAPRCGGRPSQLTGVRPPQPGTAYSPGPTPWPKLNPCPKLKPWPKLNPWPPAWAANIRWFRPTSTLVSSASRSIWMAFQASGGGPGSAAVDSTPSRRTPGEEVRARSRALPRSPWCATRRTPSPGRTGCFSRIALRRPSTATKACVGLVGRRRPAPRCRHTRWSRTRRLGPGRPRCGCPGRAGSPRAATPWPGRGCGRRSASRCPGAARSASPPRAVRTSLEWWLGPVAPARPADRVPP